MDVTELLDRIDELLADQFEDAPRQLRAITNLAFRAIRNKQCGEALNLLRQAQSLTEEKGEELAGWRAEVAALWALYHLYGCPELESNSMWKKIAEAQRLEPENERLMEVIALIKAQRKQG